jgi:hypothetical protein
MHNLLTISCRAVFVCWFVFHCHGNEIKISNTNTMADIEGVRMSVRSCSNLTKDFLAALFTVLV